MVKYPVFKGLNKIARAPPDAVAALPQALMTGSPRHRTEERNASRQAERSRECGQN